MRRVTQGYAQVKVPPGDTIEVGNLGVGSIRVFLHELVHVWDYARGDSLTKGMEDRIRSRGEDNRYPTNYSQDDPFEVFADSVTITAFLNVGYEEGPRNADYRGSIRDGYVQDLFMSYGPCRGGCSPP